MTPAVPEAVKTALNDFPAVPTIGEGKENEAEPLKYCSQMTVASSFNWISPEVEDVLKEASTPVI